MPVDRTEQGIYLEMLEEVLNYCVHENNAPLTIVNKANYVRSALKDYADSLQMENDPKPSDRSDA